MLVMSRRALAGILLFITVGLAGNVPRIWHAHTSDSLNHQHTRTNSLPTASDHEHDAAHSHSHSHSHGHSHPHSHGNGHSHSHGPSYTHRHVHETPATIDSDVRPPTELSGPGHEPTRWHSHITFFGWSFTIWGPAVSTELATTAMTGSDSRISQTDESAGASSESENSHTQTHVANSHSDWVTTCYSILSLLCFPMTRFQFGLILSKANLGALEDDRLSRILRQPPVPPPRGTICSVWIIAA